MIAFQMRHLLLLLVVTLVQARYVFKPHSYVLPHPQKVEKGGEDAHFASEKLLVVADGVGGWADQGIDPRFYSKKMCQLSGQLYRDYPLYYSRYPDDLIVDAHAKNNELGSSTMSVATIDGRRIHTCHVGDSHLWVFRKFHQGMFRIIYESISMIHGFNFPFQLAHDDQLTDDPRDAICASLKVKSGDVLILSSDGLSDNLFTHEIALSLQKHSDQGKISSLAKHLAQDAARHARSTEMDTPFSIKASIWGKPWRGGKEDDTTVIVTQIEQVL